jgi:hypothetical protein
MGLQQRRADLIGELERDEAALRRRIERKERYLESLDAMPDFDAMGDGTILAMTVTYGASKPYPVVAYNGGGKWYLTGEKSPNGISGDDLAEWLMSGGRHLRSSQPIAEFTVQRVVPTPFDLTETMLAAMREFGSVRVGRLSDLYDSPEG